jgi:Oxygenase domain of the 2OGFeDO superfamily
MMEYRVRSKRSDEWVEKYKGAQVTPEMLSVKLEGEARVLKPNGKPLAIYLPGAAREVSDQTYADFSRIRMATDNRGYASGGERGTRGNSPRLRTVPVMSGILGSFEAVGSTPYCRLTAFTAKQVEQWERLLPYFDRIAELFREHVPERYAAQMAEVERTNPEWVISGTPFTTITVNNTYPTGLHTDKGDLDAGFSTLGCIRRGNFTGGWLSFPQYGVTVDMQDGDVLLMDAHEWHGNTPLLCGYCGEALRKPGHTCEGTCDNGPHTSPERVSIVSYFRTDMTTCGTAADENAKRAALQERRAGEALGLED